MKRVHFLLREDLIKLDNLDSQTIFLAKHKLEKIFQLRTLRDELTEEIETLKSERAGLSGSKKTLADSKIKELRKEVNLCNQIELRSEEVNTKLEMIKQEQEIERKENDNELFRRSSRSDRKDNSERY